ncbi:MAG: DNA polymerase III subunit gamma/tau [Pseudomonadota bacterium]
MSDSPNTMQPGAPAAQPYRVLARKYRPQTFEALIGQDAMVRTLRNAIESGRLAHAFVMTGVRGVGKTTTARLIARALNCVGEDGTGNETITPCGVCDACTMIAAGSHPDVIEMDAASNTGVGDVRSIIDNVPYAAASARYKIYIIDEVHMLSNSAFNALLKTLEEPPAHVKFIFATTEIRKVPVTVLSRCQRFDLKRIEVETLEAHFAHVCNAEDVKADKEALALIARAAEGSVRDGLSLLDQAIAHAGETVTAAAVREMIGLADPRQVIDIAGHAFCGRPKEALEAFDRYFADGGDPIALTQEMLDLVHSLTRVSLYGAEKAPPSAFDTDASNALAAKLSVPALNTAWQILSKGLADVKSAPRAAQAAEMLLVRLAYAATLPSPADLAKAIKIGGSQSAPAAPNTRQAPSAPSSSGALSSAPTMQPQAPQRGEPVMQGAKVAAAPVLSFVPDVQVENPTPEKPALRLVEPDKDQEALLDAFDTLVQRVDDLKEGILAYKLRSDMRLVSIDAEAHQLVLAPITAPDSQFKASVSETLMQATGAAWSVALQPGSTMPSLAERAAALQAQREERARANKSVRRALELFPGAEIKTVRALKRQDFVPEPSLPRAPDGYEVLPDSAYEDDLAGHPYDPDYDLDMND